MLRVVGIVALLAGCDVVWRLDDVHGGPASDGGPDARVSCPFVDDFKGQVTKQEWDKFTDNPLLSVVQNDQLIFAVPNGIPGNVEGGVRTLERYDLPRGAYVEVEIVKATSVTMSTGGPVETYLAVRLDQNNGYVIDVSTTYLEFYSRVAGTPDLVHTRTYDPMAHRWWRFEHGPTEGDVSFSTSPDRLVWSVQKTIPVATPLVGLEIGVIVGSYNGGINQATSAVVDNFSFCGP